MAKGRTKNKNVVGEIARPSKAVDGSGAKFALEGMGLGGRCHAGEAQRTAERFLRNRD